MKQHLLSKSVFAVVAAATAALAPLTAAKAADIYEFAFRQPEARGVQAPVRTDASSFDVRNHELGWLEDVLHPAPRGAQGPTRSDAMDEAALAAERDLQQRLGGFGGPGTN